MNATKLNVGDFGDDVARLHEALGQHGFAVPTEEIKRKFYGPGTREAVCNCQKQHGLVVTGEVDVTTATLLWAVPPTSRSGSIPDISPDRLVSPLSSYSQVVPPAPDIQNALTRAEFDPHRADVPVDANIYIVEGTVASPDRAGVGGLRVQIVDKNIGQDILLVETLTDEYGHYKTHFSVVALSERRKKEPDLQARIFSGQTFLAASAICYNAMPFETLNIKLPANLAALPSEYETLTSTLAAHYEGHLGNITECDDRQDITYLAHKTGWDARAVALAALADQSSQRRMGRGDGTGEASIHPAFYYALFRAGLPANPNTLYQTDAQAVEQV